MTQEYAVEIIVFCLQHVKNGRRVSLSARLSILVLILIPNKFRRIFKTDECVESSESNINASIKYMKG